LPTIAVVLLLLLWTDDKVAPIIVTALVVLPTTYSSLKDAFYSVDDDLVKALRLFNVSTPKLLAKVYIPHILPSTVTLAPITL
jgi:NitT/TauT family transport system permease protein